MGHVLRDVRVCISDVGRTLDTIHFSLDGHAVLTAPYGASWEENGRCTTAGAGLGQSMNDGLSLLVH
jgi:hypothetical protein